MKKNLKKINLNIYGNAQYQLETPRSPILDGDTSDQLPALVNITTGLPSQEYGVNICPIDEAPTRILSASHAANTKIETEKIAAASAEGQVAVLRKLIKSSGVYALSSVALPLIALVLSPFLTPRLLAPVR